MVDKQHNKIEGRGGAAFTFLRSSGLSHEFLLVAGASRDQQFDDFWNVKVSMTKDGLQVTQSKVVVKDRDGFSARNGMTAAFSPSDQKVYLFGG